MRRVLLLTLTLGVAACGRGGFVGGKPLFQEVPETDGFAFIHELPGGTLDNLMKAAMGGVALVDYDGDGKIDVYCVNGGWDDKLAGIDVAKPVKAAKCRLYRNLGGMRFEDVTDKAGVGFTGFALGACVGDFDGDGRPDIFVSAYGVPALYRNRGDATFEDVVKKAGIPSGFYAGATFLDYDRDGALDLFVSQYVDPAEIEFTRFHGSDFAGPGAYKAQSARLFHGRGDGTFEDVSVKARVNTPGKGMGVLATDVDGDGWIDVLVANDTMDNFLWQNLGDGTFVDVAGKLNLADGADGEPRASMGVTAADLDGDGRLDYLVPDTHGGVVSIAGVHGFTDRAKDWGIANATFGFIGWADVAFDAENDGRIDVWKVHGDLKTLDGQWSKLVSNRGRTERGGVDFTYEPPDIGHESESAEAKIAGRAGVAADFDDDGREDLLAVGLNGRAHLFRNVTTPSGHWVRVRLVGKPGNTMALGARLTARAGKLKVVQEVSSATGYLSAPDPRLHFGLGAETSLDGVVVRWPSGREQRVGSLAADKDHVIKEE